MTDKPVNKSVYAHANADTKEWLATASYEEIALALDFGRSVAAEFTRRCTTPVEIPVVLGQIGEQHVETILREKFPTVINTTKASHRGDMSLWIEHRKVIIEVKNYTGSVPTLGVEKFQRDLVTSGACAGVFVSLRTPITGITDSFVIRHEYADGRSVPCAYIVSADGPAIVLAVNMVIQLLREHARTQLELYDRDRVLGGVHQLSETINDMARSRSQLHVCVSDTVMQMFKATSGLAANEETARRLVKGIKLELFHTDVITGGSISPCASCQWYAKYNAQTHQYIAAITALIEERYTDDDLIPTSWKTTGVRCMHPSGFGFHMYSGRIEVVIPRIYLTADVALMHLQMTTYVTHINITLDATSYDPIVQLIAPVRNTTTM